MCDNDHPKPQNKNNRLKTTHYATQPITKEYCTSLPYLDYIDNGEWRDRQQQPTPEDPRQE